MPFEGKSLRELTESDLRRLITSAMPEHLTLEYKRDLYKPDDAGSREFLLDICMFANGQGGLLLVGIDEQRDASGHPTGIPDPAAPLGVEVANPEELLLSYDARVVACIQERVPVESYPVPVSGSRWVLVFRVPNTLNKPHCVHYKNHAYFPSRRQRHRYYMDIREIKEMTMRAASQLQRADDAIDRALSQAPRREGLNVYFAVMPVFFTDFMLDLKSATLLDSVSKFDLTQPDQPNVIETTYSHEGLTRDFRHTIITRRNGLVTARCLIRPILNEPAGSNVKPDLFDELLYGFVQHARILYEAEKVGPPLIIKAAASVMGVRVKSLTIPFGNVIDHGDYTLPLVQIADTAEFTIRNLRPICDHFHQIFGLAGSPCFGPDGEWKGRP